MMADEVGMPSYIFLLLASPIQRAIIMEGCEDERWKIP